MKREPTRKFAVLAIILISTIVLIGCGVKSATDPPGNEAQVSVKKDSGQSSENAAEIAEYETILQNARNLTSDKKYAESNEAINQMSVTKLCEKGFEALKAAEAELREQNDAGNAAVKKAKAKKAKAKAKNKAKAATTTTSSGSNASFAFPKFVGFYRFIDADRDRTQVTLTIKSDGSVFQESTNAVHSGHATAVATSTAAWSYDVTNIDYETSDFPLKEITANVKITVNWNNGGGTQVFYGYTSYAGESILTDGKEYGSSAINEVWRMNKAGG
ncbi:hypothetical protein EQG49_04050 [Periweissella cryptocerci]|uniref:Lipoprotein n=1 Tax=Periweissella cryptocerci TaxID=2506420 RepID=A0A4P6YSQ9_9LACO|nr:hypothetical protein [Periweissella cryptocerci]QBO35690.1 hypothetical protein EQG49_04050 [Periweissella cryptocerci]